MASPTYNTAGYRRRRHWGDQHRQWGIRFGSGSMFGGNTPQYLGSGQPELESGGSLIGDGTPVYLTPPTKTAQAEPSTTTSNATAPQPATVAVVVPRS
jgi:hypothetical protein